MDTSTVKRTSSSFLTCRIHSLSGPSGRSRSSSHHQALAVLSVTLTSARGPALNTEVLISKTITMAAVAMQRLQQVCGASEHHTRPNPPGMEHVYRFAYCFSASY